MASPTARGSVLGRGNVAATIPKQIIPLEKRRDMKITRKCLKKTRTLCKQYGLAFKLTPGSVFASPSDQKTRNINVVKDKKKSCSSQQNRDNDESSSSSSVSSFEFSSDDKEDQHTSCNWHEMAELINSLHTEERTETLEQISSALDICAQKAANDLEKLEDMEGKIQQKLSGSTEEAENTEGLESEYVVDETLIKFDAQDMPAVAALRRCLDVLPHLVRKAQEKQAVMERKARLRAEEEERKRIDKERVAEALVADKGLKGDVERKLRAFGELPADSDPDLIILLEAQKSEARNLVQQILDAEREVTLRKLSLEYVDNKLSSDAVESELINDAISYAQELKSKFLAERRAEAETQLEIERQQANIPSEAEVQSVLAEQQKLQSDVDHLQDHLKKMREAMAEIERSADDECKMPEIHKQASTTDAKGRRKTIPSLGCVPPLVPILLDKTHEIHPQLVKDVEELENLIAAEEAKISSCDELFSNAEHTLRVLEECKLAFLCQIVQEKPGLLTDLLLDDDGLSSINTSPSSRANSVTGSHGDDASMKIASMKIALHAEEVSLRQKLAEFTTDEGGEIELDGPEDMCDTDSQESSTHANDAPDAFDRVVQDVNRLVRRLENEQARARGDDEEVCSDDPQDPDDIVNTEVLAEFCNEFENLTPETTAERLRLLDNTEFRAHYAMLEENASFKQQLEETEQQIELLRSEKGATRDLLGEFGVLDASAYFADEENSPDPNLAQEVQRKMLQVKALRLQWWKIRQEENTTVRRAFIGADFEAIDGAVEMPPKITTADIFDRMDETMTGA